MYFQLYDLVKESNPDLMKTRIKERLEVMLSAVEDSMYVYGLGDEKFGFFTHIWGGLDKETESVKLQVTHETKYKSDMKFTDPLFKQGTEESYRKIQEYVLSGESGEESSGYLMTYKNSKSYSLDELVGIICNFEENKTKGGKLRVDAHV